MAELGGDAVGGACGEGGGLVVESCDGAVDVGVDDVVVVVGAFGIGVGGVAVVGEKVAVWCWRGIEVIEGEDVEVTKARVKDTYIGFDAQVVVARERTGEDDASGPEGQNSVGDGEAALVVRPIAGKAVCEVFVNEHLRSKDARKAEDEGDEELAAA